jgi:hypothetical protein
VLMARALNSISTQRPAKSPSIERDPTPKASAQSSSRVATRI